MVKLNKPTTVGDSRIKKKNRSENPNLSCQNSVCLEERVEDNNSN